MDQKDEASTVANVVTPDSKLLRKGRKKDEGSTVPKMGAGAGVKIDRNKFDPSFRTKGKDSPVQRHRKKLNSKTNKKLGSRKIGEAEQFQEAVVRQILGIQEVVRKQGNKWVIYDDDTGVQIGSADSRKSAWDKQRVHRQQNKFHQGEKGKKKQKAKSNLPYKPNVAKKPTLATDPKLAPKPKKAQVPQVAKTPKVRNVKGVKQVKPISPLKPIRPKGLKAKKKKQAWSESVALGVLKQTT